MKKQYIYKCVAVFGFACLILSGGFGREVQTQSENTPKKQGINSTLLDEIKSIVKAEENSWSLDKENEYTNGSGLLWKSNKKQVIVNVVEHETGEAAIQGFADVASGRNIAVYVPVKLEKDFADEAMLRTTNLYGGSTIDFYFRQGKYTVSVWAEEKNARRFAKHILAAIKAQ